MGQVSIQQLDPATGHRGLQTANTWWMGCAGKTGHDTKSHYFPESQIITYFKKYFPAIKSM